MKKRPGLTLIEMMVTMVILALFVYIAGNVFMMTFDAYQFNRKVSAELYAQTNVDNVFSIIERELLYAGSMGSVITKLDNSAFANAAPLSISGPQDAVVINSKYALAEKITITKKDKNKYPQIENYKDVVEGDDEKVYFALFQSEFPTVSASDTRWSVGYYDTDSASNSELMKITNYSTILTQFVDKDGTTTTVPAVKIHEAFDTEANTIDAIDLSVYITPLLMEKTIVSSMPIRFDIESTDSSSDWYGEMIYNSTLTLVASDIRLQKYIPTIDESYEIILMDNVLSFEATNVNEDIFAATLTYILPEEIKEASPVTATRKFLRPKVW